MKKKRALITGITGQDGSYLAEFLLKKNYIVHGLKRKSSSFNTERIDQIYENKSFNNKFFLHYGDLTDSNSISSVIKKVNPDEIYNLAAQSHVGVSFEMPEYTTDVNSLGTLRILDAIKNLGLEKKTKFYQASTSELFGEIQQKKQSEKTKFYPKAPMLVQSYLLIGLQKIIENLIIFLLQMVYFSIMSPQEEEKLLLQEK